MKQLYCGLDVHQDSFTGCILDADGKVVREHCFPSTKEALERFLAGIPNSQMTVTIEACGIWRGVYKTLTEFGYRVKLANPRKTHDIACSKKTDKVDAKTLADLLRTRYLPEVYIPDEEVLDLRDLARHKSHLTRMRVRVQLTIKSYLSREGVKYRKSLWNKKGLEELEKRGPNIRNLVNVYRSLKMEEKEVMNRIRKKAGYMRQAQLLMTMPGIAEYSALLILAEIGDIRRFKTAKHLISYAGLCPGVYQSGARERNIRNYAVNKWLKWILYECSGRASMLDPRLQKHYHRVKKRKGFQTARRAVARKMLTIMWHMLTREEPYRAS